MHFVINHVETHTNTTNQPCTTMVINLWIANGTGGGLKATYSKTHFLNFDSEIVFELPLFCITKLMTRYSIPFLFLAEPRGFAQRQTVLYSLNYYSIYEGWNFNSGNYLFITDIK